MSLSTSVRFLLYMVLVALITKGLTEGRSLKRRHGHHLHLNHYDSEGSLPRKLSLRHLKKDEFDSSPGDLLNQKISMQQTDMRDLNHRLNTGPRRKRHNENHSSVTYKTRTEEDERNFSIQRQLDNEWINLLNKEHGSLFKKEYEVEVKAAQNSSICSYTVVAIPDTKGTRIPKDLEHVICNHVGNSCQSVGSYCCIQTFRKVKVKYADDSTDDMKVYAGCVCALREYNRLNDESILPIND